MISYLVVLPSLGMTDDRDNEILNMGCERFGMPESVEQDQTIYGVSQLIAASMMAVSEGLER